MTKDANHSTQLDETPKHKSPDQTAPQTGQNPADARGDKDKLAENQRDLGVGRDHKTEDMEEGKRGTFP